MGMSRIFNLQAVIQREYPKVQSAYSVVIAQQAEVELIACATDGTDPYDGILKAVSSMLHNEALESDYGLLTLNLITADRSFMGVDL
jgi:hypothetical protein